MWFLIWTGLVLVSLVVLGALGWQVFGKVKALLREYAAAGRAVDAATDQADRELDAWLLAQAEAEVEAREASEDVR